MRPFAAVLAAFLLTGAFTGNAQFGPARPDSMPVPVYGPPVLLPPPTTRAAPSPRIAMVNVLVSAEGKVVESTLDFATDPEFGRGAVETARHWIFKPGISGGRPDAFELTITFDSTATDESARSGGLFRYIPDRVYRIDEVDRPASIKWDAVRGGRYAFPTYPREFRNTNKTGTLSIRIVVDPLGFPVNPTLLHFTDPDFIGHAFSELPKLHFNPALKDGLPVYAYFQMNLEFRDDPPQHLPQDPRLPSPERPAGDPRRIYR